MEYKAHTQNTDTHISHSGVTVTLNQKGWLISSAHYRNKQNIWTKVRYVDTFDLQVWPWVRMANYYCLLHSVSVG